MMRLTCLRGMGRNGMKGRNVEGRISPNSRIVTMGRISPNRRIRTMGRNVKGRISPNSRIVTMGRILPKSRIAMMGRISLNRRNNPLSISTWTLLYTANG